MSAGIILTTRFIPAGNAAYQSGGGFSAYLEYMDRPEAARDSHIQHDGFDQYMDYMGNPEKSKGLFSQDKDFFTDAEKQMLKSEFDRAQKKGSNLYQPIFSFETEWLKKNGLINEDDVLIENKMREYTRSAVAELLKKEGAENWIWTAAIHHNTDNYHIHISMVDPEPAWEENVGRCKRNKETGELYQRGKFKLGTIEKAKSTFVNLAIDSKEKNALINDIVRDRIVLGKKLTAFNEMHDVDLQNRFEELLDKLPEDMRLWRYNMNAMQPFRESIDDLSWMFIERYYKSDYDEFRLLLQELSEDYKESYGNSKMGTDFYDQKHEELFYRLGNAILNECRTVRKEQLQKQQHESVKTNTRIYSRYNSRRLFFDLKNVFRKNIESLKNQAAYERFLEEERALMKH